VSAGALGQGQVLFLAVDRRIEFHSPHQVQSWKSAIGPLEPPVRLSA
jgi:hypothetical protein